MHPHPAVNRPYDTQATFGWPVFFSGFYVRSYLTLLLLVAIIFSPGLSGPFLFDDLNNIPRAHIEPFSLSAALEQSFNQSRAFSGRPLAALSFSIIHAVFGDHAWAFKSVNLFLHVLNTVLLLFLAQHLFRDAFQHVRTKQMAIFISVSAWALHPIHVSTIHYAVQFMTLAGTTSILLCCLLYFRLRQSTSRVFFPGMSLICVIMGIGFLLKEISALTPLFLLLIESYQKRHTPVLTKFRNTLVIGLPLIAIGIFGLYHWDDLMHGYQYRDFDLTTRLYSQLAYFPEYLRLIILPDVGHLSLYHDDFPRSSHFDAAAQFGAGILLSWLILSMLLWRRYPLISVGLIWFLIGHCLESTFLPLELFFEHRNYLASFGIALMLGFILGALYQKITCEKNFRAWPLIPGLLLSCLMLMTGIRSFIWHDAGTLFMHHVQEHPTSYRAQNDWSRWLYANGALELSLSSIKETQKIKPNDPGPFLQELAYYCDAPSNIPSNLVPSILEKIERTREIYFGTTAITVIAEMHLSGSCDAIPFETLDQIISMFLSNPSLQAHASLNAQTYLLRGKLRYIFRGPDHGNADFRSAFQRNPKNIKPLYQQAYLETSFHRFDAAQTVIRQIAEIEHQRWFPNGRRYANLVAYFDDERATHYP